MEFELKSQVTVAIDVLETEAIYAESIENTLDVIRAAMEHPASEMSEAIGGACWLLSQVLHMHADTLWSAAKGNLAGPLNITTEGRTA